MKVPLKHHFHLTANTDWHQLKTNCMQLDYELEVSKVVVDEADGRCSDSRFKFSNTRK